MGVFWVASAQEGETSKGSGHGASLPRVRGAFVRRQLLPPAEILDQQARHGSRRRRRSSIGRGVGVLGRYGLTMTRLLRAPETLR